MSNEFFKKKGKLFLRSIPIILMFVSMCMLKFWFSILLVFIIAIIMVLISRKRNFCNSYCPLGNLLELMYDKKSKKRRKLFGLKTITVVVGLLFWSYIIFIIFYFFPKEMSVETLLYNGNLWKFLLYLMLFSSTTAIILQLFFTKRFWCAHICPLGNVLSFLLKQSKRFGKFISRKNLS